MLITAVFAYHIRSIGLAFFVGIAIYLVVKKYWKHLASFASGVILLSLPWFIRNSVIGSGGNAYFRQLLMINPLRPEEGTLGFGDFFVRIWENLARYIGREIPSSVLKYDYLTFEFIRPDYREGISGYEWMLGLPVVAIIIFGLYKAPKFRLLLVAFIAGIFGILLLWPQVWFGPRFMFGVAPLMLFGFFNGLYNLLLMVPLERTLNIKPSPLVLLVFLFFFTGGVKALNAMSKGIYHPSFQKYFDIAEWAKYNVPDTSVIACRKPFLFYLHSERKVVQYPNNSNTVEFLKHLNENKVDYVVFEELGYASTKRYLLPAIEANRPAFVVVHQMPNSRTYMFNYKRFAKYEGETKEGLRHGKGKMVYDEGYWYEGEWKKGIMHGKGTMHYHTGEIYEGEWENGYKSGHGVFIFPDGRRYEGPFEKDLMNGEAVFTWKDGKIFKGTFANGRRNGSGELRTGNYILKGEWKNDQMVGEVEVIEASTGKTVQKTKVSELNKLKLR